MARPFVDPALSGYCTRCGTHYRVYKGHVCEVTINIDELNKPANRCADVLTKALELTGGDRAKTHGDKRQNHQNIADLWNAYLKDGPLGKRRLSAQDVAVMMCLLKIARMKSGTFNLDNFIDLAGYAGVAAECSDDD